MRRSAVLSYVLAVALGAASGVLEVTFSDILGTALFVLVSTVILGSFWPQRPWRWIVIVGAFVPLARIAAYLIFKQRPDTAHIWASGLGFVTGIAGSYAGAMIRLGVDELFRKPRK